VSGQAGPRPGLGFVMRRVLLLGDSVKRHGEQYPLPSISTYGRPQWTRQG